MKANANKEKSFDFNLKKYIIVCLKSWPIFAISLGVCTFLALVFALTKTPTVEVTAQIMLKDDTSASSMMMAGQIARSFSLGDMFGGSSTTDNETMVLKSHTVFVNTVRQLGLNNMCYERKFGFKWWQMPSTPALKLKAPEGIADTLSIPLVFKVDNEGDGKFDIKVKVKRKTVAEMKNQTLPANVTTPYGDFVIEKTQYFDQCDASTFRINFSSYNAAASSYEKIIKVYVPDRKTDFIDLSFVAMDGKFGKKVLNTLIDNYIEISNVFKFDRSTQSLELVDSRLATLQEEMQKSENALEKFKIDNKLTDVEADAQYLMNKTGMLEASLLEAQTNFEVVKLTKEFLSNPANKYELIPDLLPVASASSTEGGSTLISQYNSLILQRMRLLTSAKENNTALTILEDQINALRENIVSSINRSYENSQLSLKDLKDEDRKNKSRMGELPAIEREYIILKRDNILQEQIYLFLLQQREEINMSLEKRNYPAQIIDPPYVMAEPPGFTPIMIIALGVFLGFIFAAVYVFFVVLKKSPVLSREEINESIGAPVFEYIPIDKSASEALAVLGDDEVAEKLRKVRSDVQFALKGCNGNTVVVTSPNKNEGKTFVAVNLAASLAVIGKKTVLVDIATRDAKIASMLDIKTTKLISKNAPSPVTVDIASGCELYIMSSDNFPGNPADVVASDGFAQTIDELRRNYDYVIIDASQIRGYSDIYSLTDLSDLTLVVCRAGYTTPQDVDLIKSLYETGRLKRIAVVENAFSE